MTGTPGPPAWPPEPDFSPPGGCPCIHASASANGMSIRHHNVRVSRFGAASDTGGCSRYATGALVTSIAPEGTRTLASSVPSSASARACVDADVVAVIAVAEGWPATDAGTTAAPHPATDSTPRPTRTSRRRRVRPPNGGGSLPLPITTNTHADRTSSTARVFPFRLDRRGELIAPSLHCDLPLATKRACNDRAARRSAPCGRP